MLSLESEMLSRYEARCEDLRHGMLVNEREALSTRIARASIKMNKSLPVISPAVILNPNYRSLLLAASSSLVLHSFPLVTTLSCRLHGLSST